MSAASARHIWLCADDYGMAPGVNRAIRNLIEHKRINATSVMVVGSAIDRTETEALKASLAGSFDCAVGLHATLTAPFHPLTMHFQPLDGGRFVSLGKLLRKSFLRQLDPEIFEAEFLAQISAFKELFGRAPDYIDGHQHAHLFPQIRDAFLTATKKAAPDAWVRQCGRSLPFAQRLNSSKALLLDALSATFRKKCTHANTTFNSGFAGAYDFSKKPDFAGLMAGFLDGLPDGGVVMCHPGFVDDTLMNLDALTHQRERELAYLTSDDFFDLLAMNNVTLARK
jgi:hypothetical protein